jgi:hypothetical protein
MHGSGLPLTHRLFHLQPTGPELLQPVAGLNSCIKTIGPGILESHHLHQG